MMSAERSEKRRHYMANLNAKRIAAGQCIQCGADWASNPSPNKRLCSRCRDLRRSSIKTRHLRAGDGLTVEEKAEMASFRKRQRVNAERLARVHAQMRRTETQLIHAHVWGAPWKQRLLFAPSSGYLHISNKFRGVRP